METWLAVIGISFTIPPLVALYKERQPLDLIPLSSLKYQIKAPKISSNDFKSRSLYCIFKAIVKSYGETPPGFTMGALDMIIEIESVDGKAGATIVKAHLCATEGDLEEAISLCKAAIRLRSRFSNYALDLCSKFVVKRDMKE